MLDSLYTYVGHGGPATVQNRYGAGEKWRWKEKTKKKKRGLQDYVCELRVRATTKHCVKSVRSLSFIYTCGFFFPLITTVFFFFFLFVLTWLLGGCPSKTRLLPLVSFPILFFF